MPLQIKEFTLGQLQNNTFLVFDGDSKQAIIVDPSFQNQPVIDYVVENALQVDLILCTHAHFDHFAGVAFTAESLTPRPKILLDEKDLALWQEGGGSKHFNFLIKLPPRPDEFLTHGQLLQIGKEQLEIREVPGHSPGSVVLYFPSLKTVICGDTIFHESIGRTDLPDGDHELLVEGIRSQILSLPDETILLPGHGPHTSVGHEKRFNPYLH